MTINVTLLPFPAPAPNIQTQSQTEFSANADSFVSHMITEFPKYNTFASEANALGTQINTNATNAAASAANAATSAANAATSETNAATSEINTLSYLETFKGQYYGPLASNPTQDPNGGPIGEGDLYWNTVSNSMLVYDGINWAAFDGTVDTVATIEELLARPTIGAVRVLNYHSDIEGGGGTFYWDSARDKALHNGGTVIDPDVTFPIDWTNQTQLAAWFTAGTGTGCWVRQYDGVVNVKWFGAKGDGVTDDLIPIQNALDSSTNIVFSKNEYLLSNNLNISTLGTTITGKGGAGLSTTTLNFIVGGIVCTEPQLRLENISIKGASDTIEKGSDTTQIGVKCSAPDSNNNLDYTFCNCSFVYFNKCIEMNGRNVRVIDSVFSNSKYGVYIPNSGLADVRGLEFYNNRLHSMTKTGESGSCINIEPSANFTDAAILSNYSDDCGDFFTGFASNSTIDGLLITKGRSVAVNANSTGHGVSLTRRTFNILNASFHGQTTTVPYPSISVTGPMIANLSNISVTEHGGSGIYVSSNDTTIKDCKVTNVGQSTNNTYYGIVINGARCSVTNNIIAQDVPYSAANKMKSGFNITAYAGASFFSGNFTPNMVNSYELDQTAIVCGVLPTMFARREIEGTGAPTVGNWSRGDKVWNLIVSGGSPIGWVCTSSGTPGTWKGFGQIAV